MWALRHFRDLIYGYDITVFTDHQAVKDLFRRRNLTGRLARWLTILEDYHPTIEYLPGRAKRSSRLSFPSRPHYLSVSYFSLFFTGFT